MFQYPVLGWAFESVVAVFVGAGALVGFWLIVRQIDYRRRGYRVRLVSGTTWLYEENISGAGEQSFPFIRFIRDKGYPVPSELVIGSEKNWDSDMPSWTKGRRLEIKQRIAELFGGDIGAKLTFSDSADPGF